MLMAYFSLLSCSSGGSGGSENRTSLPPVTDPGTGPDPDIGPDPNPDPGPDPGPNPDPGPDPGTDPFFDTVSIRWDNPLSNSDGTELDFTTVSGYRVYWSLAPNACKEPEEVFSVLKNDNIFMLTHLPPGVHYFQLTTVLHNGTESVCSEEVSAVIGGG